MERKVKELVYDIETSPIIGYTWGVWQQNVAHVLADWQILSVAWHWLGDEDKNGKPKVHCIGQDDFDNYIPGVNNDIEVVKKLRDLLDEADIVIAHNGNSFDQKKVRTRILIHGLDIPSPFKEIDTKLVAKRYFAFTRNNLKWIAKDLSVAQKGDPGGIETWQGCLAGDPKAWRLMKKYNKQDIPPLEDMYLKMRPWMTNHPNMARLTNRPNACPKCKVEGKMQSRGERFTNVGRSRRYQCMACTGWCAERISIGKDEDVKPTYVNFPN